MEVDAATKQAVKYLHCSAGDSTERVRLLLDEVIGHAYGPSKTMAAVLPKRYLAEEWSKPARSPPPRDDNELTFSLLEEDLTCAVCRQIAVQAGNQLVECDSCHALYHQDCHEPSVRNADAVAGWRCAGCLRPRPPEPEPEPSPTPELEPEPEPEPEPAPVPAPSGRPPPPKVPTVNVISADRRLQIMKRKAAKQHENKRKHSKQ